jgi:NADH:ubiquinone oxidoreductase subunit K
MVPESYYLSLSAVLFTIGVVGVVDDLSLMRW